MSEQLGIVPLLKNTHVQKILALKLNVINLRDTNEDLGKHNFYCYSIYKSYRIVSLEYSLFIFNGNQGAKENISYFNRKPTDFTYEFPNDSISLSKIMNDELSDFIGNSDVICGPNIFFDICVLLSELERIKFYDDFIILQQLFYKKSQVMYHINRMKNNFDDPFDTYIYNIKHFVYTEYLLKNIIAKNLSPITNLDYVAKETIHKIIEIYDKDAISELCKNGKIRIADPLFGLRYACVNCDYVMVEYFLNKKIIPSVENVYFTKEDCSNGKLYKILSAYCLNITDEVYEGMMYMSTARALDLQMIKYPNVTSECLEYFKNFDATSFSLKCLQILKQLEMYSPGKK